MFSKFSKQVKLLINQSVEEAFDAATKSHKNVLSLQRQVSNLEDQKRSIKDELADLKKQKELEKVEIEHLVALKEQRMELKLQKREVELEKQFQQKEMDLRKQSYQEMLDHIKTQSEDVKSIYNEIMKRLPNINVKMKGGL